MARLNAWSIGWQVRKALSHVAPGQRPLFVTGTPAAWALIGHLDEVASVYFCIDNYGEIHGVDADLLESAERQIQLRIDGLVATAKRLTILRKPAKGPAFHLPQGVNFEHFAVQQPMPQDLKALPRPIIGFAGGVGPAIDRPLLRLVCETFPTATVALIGPAQTPFDPKQWPSNLHYLGPRPYEQLPGYVQAFDVGLIPYLLNAWTASVDPLKLLEYLAAGIPVVSTALPEAAKYATHIHLASDHQQFLSEIRAALGEGKGAASYARQEAAKLHRWERRAEQFIQCAREIALARESHSTAVSDPAIIGTTPIV